MTMTTTTTTTSMLLPRLILYCSLVAHIIKGIGPSESELPDGVYLNPKGLQAQSIEGKPFAAGFMFGFAGVCGDLEFKRDAHNLMRLEMYYARADNSCCKCFATADAKKDASMAYDDLRLSARWRLTILNTPMYLALAKGRDALTPFSEIEGFAWELDLDDDLHLQYQGIAPDLVGSVLMVLVQREWYGTGSLATKLERAHACAVEWAKGRMFLPDWTPANMGLGLSHQAFPEMAGKAAVIKFLVGFFASEAYLFRIANPESAEAGDLASVTFGLAEYARVTDGCGEVMEEEAVEKAVQAARTFQQSYTALRHASIEKDLNLFKIRPKFHTWEHQILLMLWTHWNPKCWSCWMDEDFMGKLRGIVSKTRARGKATISSSLKRYMWCPYIHIYTFFLTD